MKIKQSEIQERNKKFDELHENDRYCKGCGQPQNLSRAHIIRYSDIIDKGDYRRLALDINNMEYLCLDKCHKIWDDGTIEEKEKLDCFDDFLSKMKKISIKHYKFFMFKYYGKE